jgi:hypothetical protein
MQATFPAFYPERPIPSLTCQISKTAKYTENEKIILASFVREMGGEMENKKNRCYFGLNETGRMGENSGSL